MRTHASASTLRFLQPAADRNARVLWYASVVTNIRRAPSTLAAAATSGAKPKTLPQRHAPTVAKHRAAAHGPLARVADVMRDGICVTLAAPGHVLTTGAVLQVQTPSAREYLFRLRALRTASHWTAAARVPLKSKHRERLAREETVPAEELVQAAALRALHRNRTHRRAS